MKIKVIHRSDGETEFIFDKGEAAVSRDQNDEMREAMEAVEIALEDLEELLS